MYLEVSNLKKAFNGKVAVDNISFKAEKGKAYGIVGRNGAGKTTILRMILNIIKSDNGKVMWGGKEFLNSGVKYGYLPEERGLYLKATVHDQLVYFAKLRGVSASDANKSIKYWLEKFSIEEYYNRKIQTLSKGNQQKIQLINTLIHDPELVILDEPFSGLDPVNVDLFVSIIHELTMKGKCLIFSSHMMDFVEKFCEDILMLKNGKAVIQGNLKEVKSSFNMSKLMVFSPTDIRTVIKNNDISLVNKSNGSYEIKINNEEEIKNILKDLVNSGIQVNKFEVKEISLHELFVKVMED